MPLHTLRADIDYGFAEAKTTYGIIGVKVWIYKGEIFDCSQVGQQDDRREAARERATRPRAPPRRSRRGNDHVATQAHQVPQDAQGPQPRPGLARQQRRFGEYGLKATDARPADRAPDRGRASRITRYVKRGGKIWIRVFPDKPITKKPHRSAHGQRQGQRRVLGRASAARPHAVRDRRRHRRQTRARRSAWPRPSCR